MLIIFVYKLGQIASRLIFLKTNYNLKEGTEGVINVTLVPRVAYYRRLEENRWRRHKRQRSEATGAADVGDVGLVVFYDSRGPAVVRRRRRRPCVQVRYGPRWA